MHLEFCIQLLNSLLKCSHNIVSWCFLVQLSIQLVPGRIYPRLQCKDSVCGHGYHPWRNKSLQSQTHKWEVHLNLICLRQYLVRLPGQWRVELTREHRDSSLTCLCRANNLQKVNREANCKVSLGQQHHHTCSTAQTVQAGQDAAMDDAYEHMNFVFVHMSNALLSMAHLQAVNILML